MLDFFYNRAGLKGVEQLAGVPEAVCWETADPRRRWKLLVSRVANRRNVPAWCAERLDRAALACVWPRFDEKVTAQGQHARKAPWTVHKKSGRVAEPITRVSDWEIYLPQEAPRVEVLLDPFHPEHTAARSALPRGVRRGGVLCGPGTASAASAWRGTICLPPRPPSWTAPTWRTWSSTTRRPA